MNEVPENGVETPEPVQEAPPEPAGAVSDENQIGNKQLYDGATLPLPEGANSNEQPAGESPQPVDAETGQVKIVESISDTIINSIAEHLPENQPTDLDQLTTDQLIGKLGEVARDDPKTLLKLIGQASAEGNLGLIEELVVALKKDPEASKSLLELEEEYLSQIEGGGGDQESREIQDQLWQIFLDQLSAEEKQKYIDVVNINDLPEDDQRKQAFIKFKQDRLDNFKAKKESLLGMVAKLGLDWYDDGLRNSSMATFLDAIFRGEAWSSAWRSEGSFNQETNKKRDQPVGDVEFKKKLGFTEDLTSEQKKRRWMVVMAHAYKYLTAVDPNSASAPDWQNYLDQETLQKNMGKLVNEVIKLVNNQEKVNQAFQRAFADQEVKTELNNSAELFKADEFINDQLVDMFDLVSRNPSAVQTVFGQTT